MVQRPAPVRPPCRRLAVGRRSRSRPSSGRASSASHSGAAWRTTLAGPTFVAADRILTRPAAFVARAGGGGRAAGRTFSGPPPLAPRRISVFCPSQQRTCGSRSTSKASSEQSVHGAGRLGLALRHRSPPPRAGRTPGHRRSRRSASASSPAPAHRFRRRHDQVISDTGVTASH